MATAEFASAFQLTVGLFLNPLSVLSVARLSLEVQYLFHTLVASSNLSRWHDIFLLIEHIPYQILREVIIRKGHFLFAAWKLQMITVLMFRLQNNFLAKTKIIPIFLNYYFKHTVGTALSIAQVEKFSCFLKFELHLQFSVWFKGCN
jgi:hypothetical protein